LAARLGFYGAKTTGQVWFDDIQVRAVDAPPPGAAQIALTAPPTATAARAKKLLFMNSAAVFVSAVFVLLTLGVIRHRQTLATLVITPWRLVIIGTLALAIKLALAGYFFGYSPDIHVFSSWALDLYQHGPAAFYRPGYFADYPPAYMYLLWGVGAIVQNLHLAFATPAFSMVLKLPAILADLWAAWWLFRWGDLQQDRTSACIAALLWLINPLAIITSSVWGQVDSLFTLTLVLSLLAFERAQFRRAAARTPSDSSAGPLPERRHWQARAAIETVGPGHCG
jgi:Gpi18-like mannosyltransferase